MNILAIGDVVGSNGCEFLRSKLPNLKKLKSIDLVIANGENSADGNGITKSSAEYLFKSGVDVITTGNHAFRRREIYPVFDEDNNLIRPANFPESTTPGKGYSIIDMGKMQVCVINLMGVVYMESLNCPFSTADDIINKFKDIPIKIVDFHAEATAEKRALGFYLDGKISALFGTHTHVPTADETILPNGTGYITDVGMTVTINSVLGLSPNSAIKKMKGKIPVRFEFLGGPQKMDAILFNINEISGKTVNIERLTIT